MIRTTCAGGPKNEWRGKSDNVDAGVLWGSQTRLGGPSHGYGAHSKAYVRTVKTGPIRRDQNGQSMWDGGELRLVASEQSPLKLLVCESVRKRTGTAIMPAGPCPSTANCQQAQQRG